MWNSSPNLHIRSIRVALTYSWMMTIMTCLGYLISASRSIIQKATIALSFVLFDRREIRRIDFRTLQSWNIDPNIFPLISYIRLETYEIHWENKVTRWSLVSLDVVAHTYATADISTEQQMQPIRPWCSRLSLSTAVWLLSNATALDVVLCITLLNQDCGCWQVEARPTSRGEPRRRSCHQTRFPLALLLSVQHDERCALMSSAVVVVSYSFQSCGPLTQLKHE